MQATFSCLLKATPGGLPQCLLFDGPTDVDSCLSGTGLLFHNSSSWQRFFCPQVRSQVWFLSLLLTIYFCSAEEGEETQKEQEFALQEHWSGIPHPLYTASLWEGHHCVFHFSCSLTVPSAFFLIKAQPRGCQMYLLLALLHYINSDWKSRKRGTPALALLREMMLGGGAHWFFPPQCSETESPLPFMYLHVHAKWDLIFLVFLHKFLNMLSEKIHQFMLGTWRGDSPKEFSFHHHIIALLCFG